MNPQQLNDLGHHMGENGFEHLAGLADEACNQEKRRLALTNAANIVSLRTRLHFLGQRYRAVQRNIQKLEVSISMLAPWIRNLRVATVVLMFTGGAFLCFTTLSPFGLGKEAWFISAAAALVACVTTDQILHRYQSERFLGIVCAIAFLCSLSGLLVLALIRGEIFSVFLHQQLLAIEDTAVVGGEGFYQHTVYLLQAFTALLSVAMELAAGLSLHDLTTRSNESFSEKTLAEEEAKLSQEMIYVAGEIHRLEAEPGVFEATFKRDFAIGLLGRARKSGIMRWIPLVLLACLISGGNAFAETHSDIVVLFDLTKSVGGVGYDEKSDGTKNAAALNELVKALPPDTTVSVLGITDKSFSDPVLILTSRIPDSPGPLSFINQIELAKRNIAAQLQTKSAALIPRFDSTDIFGAIQYASALLNASSPHSEKSIFILSDMRNSSDHVDLERPEVIAIPRTLAAVEKLQMIAPLRGIHVFVLGVDARGKSIVFWNSLRDFWKEYFRRTGADLDSYSPTREIPRLVSTGSK